MQLYLLRGGDYISDEHIPLLITNNEEQINKDEVINMHLFSCYIGTHYLISP